MTERFELLSAEDVDAARAASRPAVVIDVRERSEFEHARIPGSRHAPVHDLGRLRARLPSSLAERMIVVGDDREKAVAAANFLVLLGFGDVGLLAGGIAAWTGPLDRNPPDDDQPAGPQLRVVSDD